MLKRLRAFSPSDWLFFAVLTLLTTLAIRPFWVTHILPMQDYSQFLFFVRAFRDYETPGSPFHGTYMLGFPVAPLMLPILIVDAIARRISLETAGKVMWSLYVVALPLTSLYLLRVLRRDRYAVMLVFPLLLFSYWVVGGFFAFATAMPLFVLGLAIGVRWLERRTWSRGVGLALVAAVLALWHALVLAQLLFDFGLLWLLWRADRPRDRLLALAPIVPSVALAATWALVTLRGRPASITQAPDWPPLTDKVIHFFDPIGPAFPGWSSYALLFALVLLVSSMVKSRAPLASRSSSALAWRVANPFTWLCLAAVVSFLAMPGVYLGVEGISNRQPWIAAILMVFAWNPPARGSSRALCYAVFGIAGALSIADLNRRFVAFDKETIGASRLLANVREGQTLFAPGDGTAKSFPGTPLIAVDLYASIRHGGLPNKSFAGYAINVIRYVNDTNPMPGITRASWIDLPDVKRFDWVLLKSPVVAGKVRLAFEARDGDWLLYSVCGGKARPSCD